MYAGRNRRLGFLYVLPALLFVLVFTAYPFVQMVWMSFHSWSLIKPPKFIGLNNFTRLAADEQFWTSLVFTFKYTLLVTPILMIGGYLLALLDGPQHAPPAVHPGDGVRARGHRPGRFELPVVVAVQPRLRAHRPGARWTWASSSEPIQWLGTDADRSTWAIIVSVTWKVIGFGMILFVAAIHAIPHEVDEATMVDGASHWQRITRVTLPLTLPTVLLVTLISVVGSLLAFDQFYIMTAGQPQNHTATSVFYIYLNSFPYLKLGYGAALSLVLAVIILAFTVVQMAVTRRSQV